MSAASERLAALLGPLPPAVAALPETAQAELLARLETACRHQQTTLDKAFDDALEHLPRLLRGTVRKMIRP
ncbi:MAG: hypothetical protein Q8J78_12035 [Moraxellaceae bacterium]|nr:hypothetical protein [Moraxellaceae bacterium]